MNKQEQILSSALKLFVAYGFHGTPTSKIATEAGVSNGTLFHYFKTKDELVVSLYNHIKDELNAFLTDKVTEAGSYKEKFRNLFIYSIQWALQHQDEFYFIQQFQFSPHKTLVPAEVLSQQAHMHMGLLNDAFSAGAFKPIPVDLIATLTGSQINGMYQHLLNNSNLLAEQQRTLINDAFELVWLMIARPDSAL
jgi:AcrR family transcriptional regulator